jgi:uncharacterized protein (DUF1684 family)
MPLRIPTDVRAAVIRDWESGKSRDTIARDHSISGAVSYIVQEWASAMTQGDAHALRELGIMLRKSGITAPQCAMGFRLARIMKELGVDEKNYDNKLGYDSTLERLRSDVERTNMELSKSQFALGFNKKVFRALSDIVSIGFDEQQKLNLDWALQSNLSNIGDRIRA